MRRITKGQIKAIHTIKNAKGWSDDIYHDILAGYGVETSTNLSFKDANNFILTHGKYKENKTWYGKYKGNGSGRRNDFLTQDQADEIARLEYKLKWNESPARLLGLIKRVVKKNAYPSMLMSYEATKLIIVLRKMTGEKQ